MNLDGTNQTRLTNNSADDFDPSFSPDGKIAFSSLRDGNDEIYVMNADGSNQINLTNNAALEFSPSFSPDSSQIAFVSTRDGNNEIYVMNADGSNQTRLTNNPAPDLDPSFSPDGSRIAFRSDRDGNPEIYVMNADGTNQTRLTNNAAFDVNPSFSPDGSMIAFRATRDGNPEIYVMNADGTNPVRLTNNPAVDNNPSWGSQADADGDGVPDFRDNCPSTPNPEKIAFVSTRDGGNPEIYVMNADGTNPTRLTNNTATDAAPSFNSNGSKIAFTSSRDGNFEIYVMNLDGTNQTRLTSNSADDFDPSFSPDGKIAFSSLRDGNDEIYVMNADGSNQINLTNNAALEFSPSFSPDGSRIAFVSTRDGNNEIYVMNADGTNQTRLTNNPAFDVNPSFSPDSGMIAFRATRDGNPEIYVMNADGTNPARLTNNPAVDNNPSWGSQADADGDGIGDACENTPPTITAIGVTRAKGSPVSNSQIATVNDVEDAEDALTVTVNDSTSATTNGVTVSNIAVNSSGSVTADVVASCDASNANFTLRVTDTGGAFSEATLSVIVTPDNIAPVIHCSAVAAQSTNPDAHCQAIVPDVRELVRAQSSDNCTSQSSLVITQNPAQGSTVSGAGSHPITVTVCDAASPTANCTQCVVPFMVNATLTLTPAKVWIGLKNSDDVGTRFDLLAEVLKNGAVVGSGQLNGVPGGSSGFNNAVLRTINLALSGPVTTAAGDTLRFRLSVRIASVGGHRSGTARLWYNGSAIDSGANRDAGSRFGATIACTMSDHFLRSGFLLNTTAGSSKQFVDVFVDRAVGGNPFKPFGTWSKTL